MKRETKGGLIQIAIAVWASAMIIGTAVVTGTDGPSPIPVCNGAQATIVGVEWLGSRAASRAPYQEWITAGVDVQADSDEIFRGTNGHDVIVALVTTVSGGFVSDPRPVSGTDLPRPTAGDFMCSDVPGADDVYYATRGQGDVIIDTGGGEDNVYAGGGPDVIDTGAGIDRIWGGRVDAGVTQTIFAGDDQDHMYVGAGNGRVVVDGGASPTDVNGGGDHIHPCPITDAVITTSPFQRISFTDIEYFGPERAFTKDIFDPCRYQA